MSELPPMSGAAAMAAGPAQRPRDVVTTGMLDALRGTRPWVRFLSILGFVVVGLMTLVSLGIAAVGVFQAANGSNEGFVLVAMAIFYLLFAVLYIFPSRFLFRYAGAIDEALKAPSKSFAVERALRHQKSFWKFAGIMALVTLLLYIPGVLAAIAIPNLLTAMQRSKQKRTMADIRTIASAVEAYATDANQYPDVKTIDELAPLLEPKYVAKLPRIDGWGTPFVYEASDCWSSRCAGYSLASGGKNGAMEQPVSDYADHLEKTAHFDEDIVFRNGQFIRAPDGV